MRKTVSGGRLILAIIKKDVRVYTRNAIYLFLTLLSLIFFVVIFWVVPDTVEEDITLAVSPALGTMIGEGREALLKRGVPEDQLARFGELEEAFTGEGFVLVELENEALLKKAVSGEVHIYRTDQGNYETYDPEGDDKKPEGAKKINLDVGIAFPPAFLSDAVLGVKPTVTVYADAAVPAELRGAMEGFIRELAFQLAGRDLPVEVPDEGLIILGRDHLGDQVSMRARMRPLIAFFMMMMETFALASLISNEVLQRTVTALLVTPVRVRHFLGAKTIFGTTLAMVQAVVVLLFVRAFTVDNWLLLLVIVLLGSLLFTAVAMLVGASGRDFIGQLMFSLLFLIPLMIPSFAVLFPGSTAAWVRVLPSYPIVRMLYDVTIYGSSWADGVYHLLYALAWVLVIYAAGLFVLKRKVAVL